MRKPGTYISKLKKSKLINNEVDYTWHGINDPSNLYFFLISDIEWGECDIRQDEDGKLILRHDSFEECPEQEWEDYLYFEELLILFKRYNKKLKLDLKEGGDTCNKVIKLLLKYGFEEDELWFNSEIQVLEKEGFDLFIKNFPKSIFQCPVDFIHPLVFSNPSELSAIVNSLMQLGINRFSINWSKPAKMKVLKLFYSHQLEVNIYGVNNWDEFKFASKLNPKSLTSDFNFPNIGYFGRGSGKKLRYFNYSQFPKIEFPLFSIANTTRH